MVTNNPSFLYLLTNMTSKPSDLIAIANPTLAKKLANDPAEKAEDQATEATDNEEGFHESFQKDIWKAVYTLNIFRYLFAIFLLGLTLTPRFLDGTQLIDGLVHPEIFRACTIVLLLSAACFTLFTKLRRFPLSVILVIQFAVDLIIASLLTYATGSITSGFALLYLTVTTTGSVVLRRKHALALASGAIILLFYEHFYSILMDNVEPRFGLLAGYGVLLLFSGFIVSQLAKRLKVAELKTYIPSNESIEEYLVRQEVRALKSALATTEGNKTEAAKLLGMTFRSFRYKLTKYDIG